MGKLTFPFRGLVALALLAPLSIISTLHCSRGTYDRRDHHVQQ